MEKYVEKMEAIIFNVSTYPDLSKDLKTSINLVKTLIRQFLDRATFLIKFASNK